MTAMMMEQLKDMDNGTFFFNNYKVPSNADVHSSITLNKPTVNPEHSHNGSPISKHGLIDRHGTMPKLEDVNFVEMAVVRRDSGVCFTNFTNGDTKTIKGLDQ